MRIELVNREDALQSLGRDWNTLVEQNATDKIFLTHEWQSAWWEYFGSGRQLLVLLARDAANELIGILPLCVDLEHGKRILRFIGGVDVSDYLDIIARRGSEEDVLAACFSYLSETADSWEGIDLHCLPRSSAILELAPEMATNRGWQVDVTLEDHCPVVTLPADWERYLSTLSKKNRHELRRKTRRLESLGDSPRFWQVADQAGLDSAMTDFVALHRASASAKAHFMTPQMEAFFRHVAAVLLDRGWLRLWMVEHGGEQIAGLLAVDYEGVVSLYNSGYNPSFGQLSAGLVLIGYAIRRSIEEGKREFDFLRGSESYKYDFGAMDRSIHRVQVSRDDRSALRPGAEARVGGRE